MYQFSSWNTMGKAKNTRDLGFRDFVSFNTAMLAKQWWRLLQYPHSLASQVLKLKYFPNVTFKEAKMEGKPFYMWKSILATRPL